jgi:hypothetical protein
MKSFVLNEAVYHILFKSIASIFFVRYVKFTGRILKMDRAGTGPTPEPNTRDGAALSSSLCRCRIDEARERTREQGMSVTLALRVQADRSIKRQKQFPTYPYTPKMDIKKLFLFIVSPSQKVNTRGP